MSNLYDGIPLYHGTDNVISSMESANKSVPDYLYVTPNPQYRYIQSSTHAYQASVAIESPYFTDNLSLIESLRSNPERRELLRQLGYDSMVYNDRRNPLKGASGWGDDAAQIVLLNPSKSVLTWSDVSEQRNELKVPSIEPTPRSAIIGPVFHATTSHFAQFAHEASTDIGFHFGSRKAANQRLEKIYGTPEIRIECPDNRKFEIVRELTESFRKHYDVIDIDGVRVDFENGWALIRASNTQPVIVFRFEANNADRLNEIISIVREKIVKYEPTIKLGY